MSSGSSQKLSLVVKSRLAFRTHAQPVIMVIQPPLTSDRGDRTWRQSILLLLPLLLRVQDLSSGHRCAHRASASRVAIVVMAVAGRGRLELSATLPCVREVVALRWVVNLLVLPRHGLVSMQRPGVWS